MAELTVPQINFAPLGQLGNVYREAQNRQSLSDLGQGLANGTVDYRAAAARTAGMGDITHTLQFLALDEAAKKRVLEQKAAADFGSGLPGIVPNPAPQATVPNPMPVPGARAPIPAPAAGGVVPSSARVVGDDEGVSAGLYDKPAAPGQRPPVQVARPAPAEPDDNTPSAKHIPFLLKSLSDPNLPAGQREIAKTMLTEAYKNSKEPEKIQTLRALKADPSLLDVEMALQKARGTQVNVGSGEKGYDTAVGKDYGETFVGFQKAGRDSVGALNNLTMMENLSKDPSFYSGTGGPLVTKLKQAAVAAGIDAPEGARANELFTKIATKSILDAAGGSLGAGFSNADRDFMGQTTAQITNTPEGIRSIIGVQKVVEKRKQDVAKLARDYAKSHGGRIDAGFDEYLQQWSEQNPAFPQTQGAAAPKDNGARVVPSTKVEIDQSLANARARIARDPGSRGMVLQKLKEAGLPTDGI